MSLLIFHNTSNNPIIMLIFYNASNNFILILQICTNMDITSISLFFMHAPKLIIDFFFLKPKEFQ